MIEKIPSYLISKKVDDYSPVVEDFLSEKMIGGVFVRVGKRRRLKYNDIILKNVALEEEDKEGKKSLKGGGGGVE